MEAKSFSEYLATGGKVLNEGHDYGSYIERKKAEFGDKFDDSELSKQFISYYENQKRIEVDVHGSGLKRGRVGITTGWKPVFLLVATTRSMGSSVTLSDKDKIIRVVSEEIENEATVEPRHRPDGTKKWHRMDNIGHAKYTINFHDGVKTHKDGSKFYDIRIFKNKPDMYAFIKELTDKGYVEGKSPLYEAATGMRTVKFYDIQYDTDGESAKELNLPSMVTVKVDKDFDVNENGADLISDKTGYLVTDFRVKEIPKKLDEAATPGTLPGIRAVREYLDLEPVDTSKDEEIRSMGFKEYLDKYLKWEGIIGYTATIAAIADALHDKKSLREDDSSNLSGDNTIPSKEEIQKLIDQYGPLEKIDDEAGGRRTENALNTAYKMSAQEAYDYLLTTEVPEWVIIRALRNHGSGGTIGLTYLVSKYKSAEEMYEAMPALSSNYFTVTYKEAGGQRKTRGVYAKDAAEAKKKVNDMLSGHIGGYALSAVSGQPPEQY